ERFLAEIKVTANLQHPNLLPLFDSGAAEGLLFYVMPYVEGESLRARLTREKQLPVDEAVRIACSILSALDYAHRHSVIHRDLKPENILMHEGQPLIADFGIALAVSNAGGARITQTGLSLGTPQYMSPEQATGDRVIDGRTDMYSMGAMLYEMLVGDPPYTGSTSQAIIAKVLTDKPRAVRLSRASVPVYVEAAVDRALEKLPADRFATAHEFAEALQGKGAVVGAASAAAPATAATSAISQRGAALGAPRSRASALAPWALATVFALVAGWAWMRGPRTVEAPTLRFAVAAPTGYAIYDQVGTSVAISPDGETIALVALSGTSGIRQLFVRTVDQLQMRPIAGTENAGHPTFSPDGTWIAFVSGPSIKKVAVLGGSVVSLGDVQGVYGLSWAVPGTIVAGNSAAGIFTVPATGGTPRQVTRPDSSAKEISQRFPLALADGKTVVYTSWFGGLNSARIGVASLETGKSTTLDVPGTSPLGLIDGRLVFASSSGSLMAVPFSARKGTVAGAQVPVADGVLLDGLGGAKASLSATGTLIFRNGLSVGQPVLVDGRGVGEPLIKEPRGYETPRFSPDGNRVALTIGSPQGSDVWVYDLAKTTLTRLTTEGVNSRPEWTPDGKRILFRSERSGDIAIWWQPADLSGPAALLYKPDDDPFEALMSPDGKALIYRTAPGGKHSRDIFWVPLEGEKKPQPLVVAPFRKTKPRLSPDGHWLAYDSDEPGSIEVFVRPFPGEGARVQVSTNGGGDPMWARSGRALYYTHGKQIIAATVTTGPAFSVGARQVVLEGDFMSNASHQDYDVAPDGQHFLMIKRAGDEAQTIMVHNWAREVRARAAVPR
ncbi:MAG: protein kinase, partial [Gemmatimonadales bacterium]